MGNKLQTWKKMYETWSLEGGFRGAIARKFGGLKKFRSFKQGGNQILWMQCSLWISHNLDWQREEKFVIQPHNTWLLWIDEQVYRSTWLQCFVQISHGGDQQHGNKHLCSNLTIISLHISMNIFKMFKLEESKNLWNNSKHSLCTMLHKHVQP
jgi:hypothetical protein